MIVLQVYSSAYLVKLVGQSWVFLEKASNFLCKITRITLPAWLGLLQEEHKGALDEDYPTAPINLTQ